MVTATTPFELEALVCIPHLHNTAINLPPESTRATFFCPMASVSKEQEQRPAASAASSSSSSSSVMPFPPPLIVSKSAKATAWQAETEHPQYDGWREERAVAYSGERAGAMSFFHMWYCN